MAKINDILIPSLTLEEILSDGSTLSNPAADHRRLFLGEDGLLHLRDSAGSVTDIGGGSGGVATDAIWDAAGDLAVGTGADTAAKLAIGTSGHVLTSNGTTATWAAAAGGMSVGQMVAYPTTFTGDVINGSSTTPFVDVDAFTSKTVENSRILHLQTDGASKDDRVRVTLGTPKAGIFDVRACVMAHLSRWSADRDTYFEIRLSDTSDVQIALVRMYGAFTGPNSTAFVPIAAKMGTGSPPAAGSNFDPSVPIGTPVTLRFQRDGSNNVTAQIGIGNVPMALGPLYDGALVPLTASAAQTLERIEFSIHTPSGPGSTAQAHAFIDYVASV